MEDLTQRDLSQIPESELSPAERQEIERRKMEFLAVLRQKGGLPQPEVKKPEKKVTPWDPLTMGKRRA